ncbi:MAG: hypothetical protein APF80_13515 [Alphaproteobacteria bacterium BRH_c36]|nr:MAG: hypothetical protein APF80_13515 [Alphaproteobacteria bacterium BRH_c36]
MDLEIAKTSDILLLNVTRVMAFFCFALAGLLLVASLQVSQSTKAGVSTKSVAASPFLTPRTL